jgi:N utilization substance protein A
VERLFEAGIGTVERLGSMTPEEIQSIPGITAKALESIQYSVNAYYGPYEDEVAPVAPVAEASASEAPESAEPAAEPEVPAEPMAEVPVEAAEPAVEPEPEA